MYGDGTIIISDANGSLDPEAPPANYGRRRSRAVLYQLSGHYKQDNKHKIKLNNVSGSFFSFKTAFELSFIHPDRNNLYIVS